MTGLMHLPNSPTMRRIKPVVRMLDLRTAGAATIDSGRATATIHSAATDVTGANLFEVIVRRIAALLRFLDYALGTGGHENCLRSATRSSVSCRKIGLMTSGLKC